MKPFSFCPSCGRRLEPAEEPYAAYCPADDRTWYRNPAPTVGAAIVRDGRCLVTIRGSEPEKGRVDVPGGFVEPGEGAVEALKREVREELGVKIDVSDESYVQAVSHRYGDDLMTLAIGFLARLVSGEPSAASDVAACKWVTEEDLGELDFAWEHDRDLVRKALRSEQE